MSTYLVYRIKCVTDNKHEHWTLLDTDPSPTTCPTNTAHTVDLDSLAIIKTIADNIVKIREESTETGGNFCCETISMSVATGPGVTSIYDFSWPFPTSHLGIHITVDTNYIGDYAQNVIGPNTIIGILVAPAATGATGIYVNSTVTDNVMIGYDVDLLNSGDYSINYLGRVLEVDKANSKIVLETPTTQSFPAYTTYIRQTVVVVRNFDFINEGQIAIGSGKIGGSYLPPNIKSRIIYTNNSTISKIFSAQVEYLY